MPRQREVKPWTIYPPTQEDREIIEQKAAAASLSVSAYLCMVGKLACIAVNLPTEQKVLSEQELVTKQEPKQEPVKKPSYTLHTTWGKRLTPEQAAEVEEEIAAGRVAWVADLEDGNGWKQYKCTEKDIEYIVRPVKEV